MPDGAAAACDQPRQTIRRRRRRHRRSNDLSFSSRRRRVVSTTSTEEQTSGQQAPQTRSQTVAARRLEQEVEETHRLNDRLRTSVDRLDALVTRMEQFAEAFQQRAAQQQQQAVENQNQNELITSLKSRLELIEQRLNDQQDLLSAFHRVNQNNSPTNTTMDFHSSINNCFSSSFSQFFLHRTSMP